MQQNVQIDMITADAWSSNVLHDTSTIANTPGAYPFYRSLVLTNWLKPQPQLKQLKINLKSRETYIFFEYYVVVYIELSNI